MSSSAGQSTGSNVSAWQLPVSTLFGDMCWRLLMYGPMEYEQPSGAIAQDKVLCGILCLLRLLVEHRQDLKQLATQPLHDLKAQPTTVAYTSRASADSDQYTPQSAYSLISLLFLVYLFNLPPKARHPDTRGQALSLLTSVCSLPVNSAVLFALISRQHLSLTHLTTFDFNVEKLVRSSHGHVGLRNLGSTCLDLRTQVVVDVADGRGPRWMDGDEVWQLWQDKHTRSLMRVASLQTAHEAEAAMGEPCGTRDELVYSQLMDVVAPFVYEEHYDVDEHPVHIRAGRSTGADLLLTPDHMVWAAPFHSHHINGGNAGTYRRVRADEVVRQAALGVSWELKLTAPVSLDKDYSFTLPSLSATLDSFVDVYPGRASLSSLRLSSAERCMLDGLVLTGAAMDAWLAFVGFHIAARGGITSDSGETQLRYHQPPPHAFVRSVASRLPACLSAAVLDAASPNNPTAATVIVCMVLAGVCNAESSPLPSWLWRLSARQLRVLFVGMSHAQQRDAVADVAACEWCCVTHAMPYALSSSSRQRADDVQLLAVHAGLVSHVSFIPAIGYTVTSYDRTANSILSSSTVTSTKRPRGTAVFDKRSFLRSRRFWCVTTAASSHVVLVRRRVYKPNGVRSYHTALVGQCYMNSLLQQLYMMPSFRYGVWLSAPDCPIAREEREAEDKLKQLQAEEQQQPDAAAQPAKEQKAVEYGGDDLLYQLQVMFTYLSQSTKQYYDTLPFAFSYKDERGQPINVRIQQDAQEFFNVLLDRLEKRLMSLPYPSSLTPLSHLIQSSFGGTLVNQLLCHACHNIRSSPEPFYSLSLQVKNKSTLSDSLDAYVLGEELSDFNCSACKQRVNITKRVCLGNLPPVVIMHLKRFELNYETFQHEKLNNRFVFPLDVNLEPYTIEGLARIEKEANSRTETVAVNGVKQQSAENGASDNHCTNGTETSSDRQPQQGNEGVTEDVKPLGYYDYELVGILIHTGNSTSGHYYSFVKDRCLPPHNHTPFTAASSAATSGPSSASTPVWLEFNDNQIRPFDLSSLDEAAYGGEQEVTERTTWGNDIITQQDKVKNAYMLIYERKQPNPAHTHPQPATNGHALSTQPAEPAASDVQKAKENAEWLRPELLSLPLSRIIPPSMLTAVERDNQQFQFDRQVFNADYFTFLIHFIRSARPAFNATPLTLVDLSLIHSGGVEAITGTVAVEVLYPLRLCQLMTVFAFDCLVRCADNKCFVEYSRELQLLYEGSMAGCQWLLYWLAGRASALGELLLACRDEHVRDGVKGVIVTALRKVSVLEVDPTLLDTVESEVDNRSSAHVSAVASPAGSAPSSPTAKKVRVRHYTSLSARYIAAHLTQLTEAAKHWMRFTQYFELLYQFALIGPPQCYFLVANGCIARLCDMYLGEASPLNYNKRKRASIGNVMVAPNWPVVLELVAHLVRSCRTDQSPRCLPSSTAASAAAPASPTTDSDSSPPLSPSGALPALACLAPAAVCPNHSPYTIGDTHSGLHLHPDDEKVIKCPHLYQLALSQNVAVQSISLLACHWCWEDAAYSDAIYDMLLGSFGKLDHALNERPYLDTLLHITAISDSLTQHRFVRLTHGSGHNTKGLIALLLHIRHTQPRKTWAGVTLLLALARQVPNFALHLGDTRGDWLWMDAWTKDHASRGKPKGILAASSTSVAQQQDEDREAVWQQYETMVKALGHKLELPVLHPPTGVSGMAGISGGVVGHHQLSRRLSAEDGGACSEQTSPAAGQSRHRRASHIDTIVAYSPALPATHGHFTASKQQRKPANRTEAVQQSQRGAGQRTVDTPKLVSGQPSLARRFVSANVARGQHESEDELDSDDSDDMRRPRNEVAASFAVHKRQQQHQPIQQADDDDIYEPAERDRTAMASMQALAADEDDDMDEADSTYQQQEATALGDEDNDDEDDELTASASTAATTASTGRNRRGEAYNLSPSSPVAHRANLSFEAGSARIAATNVGTKRRAPTTPVGLGSGGRAKGKAAPNSPASVGRSRADGGAWSVRRDSSDGGSGSGSGSGNSGGGSGGAQIACGTCTFFNPSHARVCEMCESSLS